MAKWADTPEPSIPEWLAAAKTYFEHRGYRLDNVRLLVERQHNEIDHIVRSPPDIERIDRLIAAIFEPDGARLAKGDLGPRQMRRSFAALQLCFADFPILQFKRGIGSQIFQLFGYLISAASFVVISYLVIGAILVGQSDFEPARDNPAGGLAILTLLLILLAYVEGSHISIARLQGANIAHGVARPRVVRLHRAVRSERDSSRFFAGRQILVILIIFFVSRLTSFADLRTFPWTEVPLPDGDLSFLTVVFVRYGIAGAIFVYWLGQMLPQIIANKYPTWVMSGFFGEAVARAAKFIGDLGIAAPVEFAARFFPSEAPIPQADRERYSQHASDAGWSYLLQSKEWRFTRAEADFSYRYVVDFRVPGMKVFSAIALEVLRTLAPTASVTTRLFRGRLGEGEVETTDEDLQDYVVGQSTQFIVSTSPKHGNYEAGDILMGDVQGKTAVSLEMEDGFIIKNPVQHFVFRCVFDGDLGINAPVVYIDRIIEEGRSHPKTEVQLPIEDHEAGYKKFELAVPYPPIGTRFRFVWTFDDG